MLPNREVSAFLLPAIWECSPSVMLLLSWFPHPQSSEDRSQSGAPFCFSFFWYRWWRSSWWQWHCNTLWWNCESRSKVNRDTIAPMFEHRKVPFVCSLLYASKSIKCRCGSFFCKHSLEGIDDCTWTWAPPQNKLSLMKDSEALLAHSSSQCLFLFCLQIGGEREPFVFTHLELIGRIMGWLNQIFCSVVLSVTISTPYSLPQLLKIDGNSTLNIFTLYCITLPQLLFAAQNYSPNQILPIFCVQEEMCPLKVWWLPFWRWCVHAATGRRDFVTDCT